MVPPCFNLPGRIHEIRELFGAGSVESVYQTPDSGARYVRYFWRGEAVQQLSLDDEAA